MDVASKFNSTVMPLFNCASRRVLLQETRNSLKTAFLHYKLLHFYFMLLKNAVFFDEHQSIQHVLTVMYTERGSYHCECKIICDMFTNIDVYLYIHRMSVF